MTNETTMIELLQEMKQKMKSLQNKVEEMQQQQQQTPSSSGQEFEEDDDATGNLVELLESTESFLEVAFSMTVTNSDHKKWLYQIGAPECDAIRCPKLDSVVQSIVPNDTIKADGYLSHLHQFWLDTVTSLIALIKSVEGGELKTEGAVMAAQSALYFLGNVHQHMLQERHKKMLMNLNPALKLMANDEKVFKSAASMLFGDEFVTKAIDRVEQLEAITKVATKPEAKKTWKPFFQLPPPNLPIDRPRGWKQKRPRTISTPPEIQQAESSSQGQKN